MNEQDYPGTTNRTSDLFSDEPLVYAAFGERFGAALIDGLILAIPNALISIVIEDDESVSANIISICLYWLYNAILESSAYQATLGKRALGIKVIDMEGQRISFGQATGRYFGKIISALILGIGFLMMLWDDKKQTLHDKMAATLVIKQ